MISTCFFLLLFAFQLWYWSSSQLKAQPAGYPAYVPGYLAHNPRTARLAGGVLAVVAAGLLVGKLGWMTGLSAGLVGLMGVGCLVVMLAPFRYLSTATVMLLYAFFLTLEVALS